MEVVDSESVGRARCRRLARPPRMRPVRWAGSRRTSRSQKASPPSPREQYGSTPRKMSCVDGRVTHAGRRVRQRQDPTGKPAR
eukprot:6666767-Prymnesium_polylepis.1